MRLLPGLAAWHVHLAHGGRVIVAAQGDTGQRDFIAALDPRTAATSWCIRCGHGKIHCVLLGDLLVASGDFPFLYGIDPAAGTLRWRVAKQGQVVVPALIADPAANTVTVYHDADLRGRTVVRTIVAADGRVLHRSREPQPAPPPPLLLAPGRPAFRSVAIDERRGVEILTAADLAPLADGPSSRSRLDFLDAHAGETRLVVFDLHTGAAIEERTILAPETLGGAACLGAGLAFAAGILCAFSGPLAYGLWIDGR